MSFNNSLTRKPADFSKTPAEICVLLFSSDHTDSNDHLDVISQCLDSILTMTDPDCYKLHIGLNNVSPRVLEKVQTVQEQVSATLYIGEPSKDAEGNTVFPKYPLMRQMFQATQGDWLVWFDDDSYVTEQDWLEQLESAINQHPEAYQFGKKADVPVAVVDQDWISDAKWFNEAHDQTIVKTRDGESAVYCDFIVGGFYTISRAAIEQCDVPDQRLFHNGGDWATGLAMQHHGLPIANHVYGVKINSAPRRGMHRNILKPCGVAAKLQQEEIHRDRDRFIL